MSTTTTLKLSLNGEMRRIAVDVPISYRQLLDQTMSLFPILEKSSSDRVEFAWIDDENDRVVISSDAELQEAFRTMSAGKGYLRFEVSASVDAEKNEAPPPRSEVKASAVHAGVTCNECGQSPLCGVRYKCSVRKDYDICASCEVKGAQPYPMIKIYDAMENPVAADNISVVCLPGHGGMPREGKGMGTCKATGLNEWKPKKHRGVVCDECGCRPIEGVRYKCTVRDDFDLCSSCETKKSTQPFPMVKVYSPFQCPGGLHVITPGVDRTVELDINLPRGIEILQNLIHGPPHHGPPRHHRGPPPPHHGMSWGPAGGWKEGGHPPPPPAAPPAASEGPARHRHVRCNECGMKPIVGVRYKCAVRPDYDLCEACEVKGAPQPYPVVKVYFPEQQATMHGPPFGPRGRMGGRGGCGGRGGGWHGKAGRGCGWRVAAAAEAAAERARVHEAALAVEKAQHEAKELDDLVSSGVEDEILKQAMEESLESVATSEASEESKFSDKEVLPTATVAVVPPLAVVASPPTPKASAAPTKPMARFVRDVSMTDGSKVEPCSVFVKTWRVRNDGVQNWPEGAVLMNAGGDVMFDGEELRIPVPAVSAGDEVDIAVHLTAPSATGRHVGYFRLQTPEGSWFGQRLWADIRVLEEQMPWQVINSTATLSIHDDEEQEEESQGGIVASSVDSTAEETDAAEVYPGDELPAEEQVEPSDEELWAHELEMLASMGFCDREVVISLLKEHVGIPSTAGNEATNPEGMQTVVFTLLSNSA